MLCRSCGILHDGHIASLAVGDELGGTGSKGVAIVGIEVGRSGTTSFVAEEVVLGCKLAIVLAFLLPLCQLSLTHLREKFFGLDERHLYVAVRVTVERELTSHTFRQRLEGGGILLGQVSDDVFALCLFVQVFIVSTMSSEQVVQFLNESADGWNKFDKAFGDNDRTEVVACSSTGCDDLAKLFYHLVQREVFLLDFLRNQTDVGLRLKGTFQCDMGSRTSHHLNEMPVFACRITVALNVSNQLGIGFASGVEAEGRLNLVVLQVAVDGLRTANHLYAILLGCIVFCQYTCIGIGVVAANDDNGFDVELADDFKTFLKLFNLLQFGSSGTNHVETARVAIFVNDIGCQFHIVMIDQTAGTQDEAKQAIGWIQLLDGIEKTCNHVVATRSLTTTQDDAHIHRLAGCLLSRNKLNEGHAVGIREQSLDFLLIVNTLGRSAFFHVYGAFQSCRQLRLVGCSCYLQCTFSHSNFTVRLFIELLNLYMNGERLKTSQRCKFIKSSREREENCIKILLSYSFLDFIACVYCFFRIFVEIKRERIHYDKQKRFEEDDKVHLRRTFCRVHRRGTI